MVLKSIEIFLPREGPETHHKEEPSLFQQGIYRYLSTSRGDGNRINPDSAEGVTLRIATYLPRERPEAAPLVQTNMG